jgi:hypothetical protein
MDEKRKKYWEEVDSKRKERRQKEEQEHFKQDTENEMDDLMSEIIELKESLRVDMEVATESINELRDENAQLQKKIDSLEEEMKSFALGLKKQMTDQANEKSADKFVDLFLLLDQLIRINIKQNTGPEITLDEKLRLIKNQNINQLKRQELYEAIDVDLQNSYPNVPLAILRNAIDAICELMKDNLIDLNVKNISKAIIIFDKLDDLKKANELLLRSCSD